MSFEQEQVLGYFAWEGDPCRIIVPREGYSSQVAEIYVAGSGFERISLTDLMCYGVPIAEAEFKALVMESIALAKSS
jgi:hypothetical protein